ncbi:MAG: histidine--tRNA ligase [Chitinispirillales bacterium]|jgi:histidyl-tRNA synthetase|nr:histidine--tRNA ligase [Chitinispirillales bacterium]
MAAPAQGPKGTRDFYPEDMAFQQYIFDSWHSSCKKYGFEQYEGPMFEHLEIYTQKSGDEIEKQLYTFEDKAGRKIALRPELTPTLARMAAAGGTNLKRPVRWYSISRLFRYEKMQKGRLREFIQLNMDILGVEETAADAELIAASIDTMRAFGFNQDDFKVRISSRTLLEELFLQSGVERGQLKALYALLDKKNKISADVFSTELSGIVAHETVRKKIDELFSSRTLNDVEQIFGTDFTSLKQLKQLFSLLDAYGLDSYAVFDIGIVRGLAYYTGIVFELFDVKGNLRAIAGGGRYDNLVKLYGGPQTPAVGFAVGDVVLGELLKSKGIAPPQPPRSDLFLISIDNDSYTKIISTAQKLRNMGISCEFSLKENSNIGKQLKLANNARSRFALFIGGEEATLGKMRLKNLIDGSEELVDVDKIEPTLKTRMVF